MAEDRVFTLIGRFDDGISPVIEGINRSIDSLKKNLGGFAGKNGSFGDLTKSMGKVVSAHKKLNEEVKSLREEMRNSLPVLKEYRKEVGKAVSANMHLTGKKFSKKNNPHLQYLDEAIRGTRQLGRETRAIQFGPRMRRGGGGAGGGYGGGGGRGGLPPRPPRTPSVPLGGGGYVPSRQVEKPKSTFGTSKFGVSRDAQFAFGQTLGYTLGTTITGAIVQGFQIGVGLMAKPFQMFAGALQERIQDELSDISAAGGLLSVAKRQEKSPIVKSFQDAMDLTQLTNKRMAEIAAALPGNTQQYIEVGKRLGDTAARMIAMDPAKAIRYAQELAVKEGAGRTVTTQQQAYTQIIGNMSTQGVLAGLGDGGAGARGVTGAYGLPQLMERIYNEDNVTMGQFQRYAAIFRDPKISDALERFIPQINATLKGSIDRAKIMDKFFEEVLPPEMIRAFERSTAGIMEAFRTAFIGPETGILGLGRKFEDMGKKMDSYGRYLDAEGNITSFEKAASTALSLFDILRDIFANISIALYPLIDILPQIFDPLKKIGDLLVNARHLSGQFLQTFENYVAGIDAMIKGSRKGDLDFAKTKKARAGLLAISNFLTDVGVFSEKQFESMRVDILDKPSKELGGVLNNLLKAFFASDSAYNLGNLIGTVIGTVLAQVATIIEGILGIVEPSKLASGLKAGFYAAKGPEAMRSIFQNLFKALFKGILEIFKIMPLELGALAAITTLLPAFVSSFSIILANRLEAILDLADSQFKKGLGGKGGFSLDRARQSYLLGKASPEIIGGATALRRTGAAKSPAGVALPRRAFKNPLFPQIATPGGLKPGVTVGGSFRAPTLPQMPKRAAKSVPVTITNVAKNAFTKTPGILGKVGSKLGAGGLAGLKNPLGMLGKVGAGLTAFGGILNGIITLFQGGTIWEALGATAGPIAGTIIGTAIAGPLGGILGGWIGGLDEVTRTFGQIFEWVGQSVATFGETLGQLGSDMLLLVQSITGAKTESQALQQVMVLLKIAAFPLLATLDLLNVAAKTIQIAFLEAAMFIDKTFQGGRKQDELNKRYAQANASLNNLIRRNDDKYASWSRSQGTKATLGGKEVMWDGWKWVPVGQKPATPEKKATPRMGTPGAAGTPGASPTADPVTQNLSSLNSKATAQVTHTSNTSKNTLTASTTLGNIRAGIMAVSNKLSQIQSTLSASYLLMASGNLTVKTASMGIPSMGGASAGGGVDSFSSIAQAYGLSMTSGYRPGDPGWHGANRARDYSNGTGPTPQMMQFAQYMASTYGSNLKELIYTPLGYSIKDGKAVAPYAQAGHYNHVHVAYALGAGNPAFFSNKKDAVSWEKKHLGPGIGSLTTNTAELSSLMAQVKYGGGKLPGGGSANWMQILEEDYRRNKNKPIPGGPSRNSGRGGLDMWEGPGSAYISPQGLYSGSGSSMASAPINVTSPITINTQPGQDADEIASIVAMKIGDAVAQARAASVFT